MYWFSTICRRLPEVERCRRVRNKSQLHAERMQNDMHGLLLLLSCCVYMNHYGPTRPESSQSYVIRVATAGISGEDLWAGTSSTFWWIARGLNPTFLTLTLTHPRSHPHPHPNPNPNPNPTQPIQINYFSSSEQYFCSAVQARWKTGTRLQTAAVRKLIEKALHDSSDDEELWIQSVFRKERWKLARIEESLSCSRSPNTKLYIGNDSEGTVRRTFFLWKSPFLILRCIFLAERM